MEKKILITNIQRYCLHDGPGIRTTVFLKGCNLHCPWCENPENIHMEQEEYIDSNGSHGIYGKMVSLEEIFTEAVKDKAFYIEGGGVTFSGGEPLLKIIELEPLIFQLRKHGINTCVETALFVERKNVKIASQIIDLFIIDLKIVDKTLCQRIIGGQMDLYLSNLRFLKETGKIIWIRVPLIPHYTSSKNNLDRIIQILKEVNPERVD